MNLIGHGFAKIFFLKNKFSTSKIFLKIQYFPSQNFGLRFFFNLKIFSK